MGLLRAGPLEGRVGSTTLELLSAETRERGTGGEDAYQSMLSMRQVKRRGAAETGTIPKERKLEEAAVQCHAGEEDIRGARVGIPREVTRNSAGKNADPRGHGPEGSTGGARLARHAPPWWSGASAATWIPHSVSSRRTLGVVGFGFKNPSNCMEELIRNRVHGENHHFGVKSPSEQPEVKHRVQAPTQEEQKVSGKSTKKGSFDEVMDILKEKEKLAKARQELRKDFMADSSRASQRTKREQVLAMAAEARDPGAETFPLKTETVEAVAAAIKAVGWTSGDQYINELKLMHIEAGWDVSQQLSRALADCKRSLRRNRGPVKRAPEFRLEDIEQMKWILTCRGPKKVARPALAYAWAVVWMLREIEVSAMRWRDVSADWSKRRISIFIPVSKCDQQALGVRRTMQCCAYRSCQRWCPWKVWVELWRALRGEQRDPHEFIFQDAEGKKLSKAKMVEGWAMVTTPDIQGHSARRSGAMGYVRLGMPIQELAFLGRWKSSVVLNYAEDALQTEPANRNLKREGDHKPRKQDRKFETTTKEELSTLQGLPEGPMEGTAEGKEGDKESEQCKVVVTSLPKKLWVASTAYSSRERVWHQVEDAGWDVPIEAWTSICGWPFSRNSSKVILNSQLTVAQRKCKKCIKRTCGGASEDGVASSMRPAV